MTDELLPCPFCGKAPKVSSWVDGKGLLIACYCDLRPKSDARTKRAIAAWNRRATPTEKPMVAPDTVGEG